MFDTEFWDRMFFLVLGMGLGYAVSLAVFSWRFAKEANARSEDNKEAIDALKEMLDKHYAASPDSHED
jgi:uncharacterized membrane-anchored protein YhcB (DUF1043 family)